MYRLQKIIELCAILFLAMLISQCTHTGDLCKIHTHYADLKSTDFNEEIARLQKITIKPQDTSAGAMVHLQLALLYSHYRTPTPNYQRALTELETYIFLDPEGGKADIIQNWLTILKEIVRLDGEHARLDKENARLDKENARLDKENARLDKENARLDKENNDMKGKIEQLQYLDIELEKRRKQVK